jgi:sortase A
VTLRLVRYFVLAVAVACLGVFSGVYLERALYQSYEDREFDRTLDAGASAIAASNKMAMPPRARRPSATALIGRLTVPRLHLSAMVREGVDGKTLRLAIGHIPATALPGQSGNVAVAGHRDTFFRGLKDLRAQDEIQFSTFEGDFKYRVESLIVVAPDNVSALAPSSENVLTMVTCYPFFYVGAAPKRFIVRARQVSPKAAPPLTVE